MKYPNQEALLNKIIETLETGQAHFPRGFNLMSTEEWCQKMRADPKFYFFTAKDFFEIKEYENLLIIVAAQCLERKIQVVPFLQQDEGYFPKIFPRTFFSRLKSIFSRTPQTFSLMSSQKFGYEKSFFSILKKDTFNPRAQQKQGFHLTRIQSSPIKHSTHPPNVRLYTSLKFREVTMRNNPYLPEN